MSNPTKLAVGDEIHGFIVEEVRDIPELRNCATVFSHKKTGARMIHLSNDDPNNLFCIGFRTPVYNNTGVPHILEHSVLSGSKKYPVKDPFKEMLNSSLQTFLNAMTYSDKTLYPVSSQVEQDFFNLADVYCDAVFNPILSEITFSQEGWHYHSENKDEPIGIKGIVYNEMKGVFSEFSSHVTRKTIGELMPDTTYYYESGGEPEHIPELSYEEFKTFHRDYYHPSNSYTVVYGDIPVEKSLKFLNDGYLTHFDRREIDSSIAPQPHWTEPRSITIDAPTSKENDGLASHIVCWLFGESRDPEENLFGSLLSHYFFNSDTSPLKRALMDSGLGEDLDDLCGFEGDLIQRMFFAGLRKCKPEDGEKVKEVVYNTIQQELDKGLDFDLIEGAIRQIEFSLREISNSGYPHNLSLAERAIRAWVYGYDPLDHLAFEKPLNSLKDKIANNKEYFSKKIKEMFLENNHVLVATVRGSAKIGEDLGKQTELQAKELTKDFTQEDKDRHYDLTQELLKAQNTPPSAEALATLPKFSYKDLPKESKSNPIEEGLLEGVQLLTHPIFTAGIVYLDMAFDLRHIPQDLLPYFPLYTDYITRCGAGKSSCEEMSKRVALSTGGIYTSDFCGTHYGSDDLIFKGFFHGKSLPERFGELVDIYMDIFTKPDLDDKKLIKDLLYESRNDLMSSVSRSGHSYAILKAASYFSQSRHISELTDGISQLRFLEELVRNDSVDLVSQKLKELHALLVNRETMLISVTTIDPKVCEVDLARLITALPSFKSEPQPYEITAPIPEAIQAFEINSSVNYAAQSWKLPPATAAATGEISLITRELSTGYLWDNVRIKGGAYGGMSMSSDIHRMFSCASYRDPNVASTYGHFTAGLESIKNITQDQINNTMIGVVGKMDHPQTPHSKGFSETMARLMGKTPEVRQEIRDAVLSATPEKLSRRVSQILDEKVTASAVIGSKDAFDEAKKQGLSLKVEPVIPQ